jgi:DNA (cytosine-5)-methyltransferase 1
MATKCPVSAQSVGLSLSHKKPDCAWTLDSLDPRNGVRVMSTFACGGGSSLGYKLAGCEVVAANDIDPEMAWHYRTNIRPKHYFLCPIRDLLSAQIPEELKALDILDGSPPCSTFSIAGSREKYWGKKKHFREGQAEQVLSDLFFDFLDVAERLMPKVVVAENVRGMVVGNAKGYAKLVCNRLRKIGYRPQVFLINAVSCGVPQKRERVFFCAVRGDMEALPLTLTPTHRVITAGEATADVQDLTPEEERENRPRGSDLKWWHRTMRGHSYKEAVERAEGRCSLFQHVRLNGNDAAPTLSANHTLFTHWDSCRTLTFREWKRLGSFPDDYVAKSEKIGKYMVGMSVPPRMTKVVADAVISQWIKGGTCGKTRTA